MRIVDAHHHLWNPNAIDYSVLQSVTRLEPVAVPRRAIDFDTVAIANGVATAIAVEAASAGADHVAETAWLLAEISQSTVSRSVVAYLPVELAGVGAQLDALIAAHGDRIVGIRRTFEAVPPGFAYSDAVIAGVRSVAGRGLPFDIVLFSDRLADAIELALRVPEATFVLDHLGKPPLERPVQEEWKVAIAALGKLPNVVAKISGLVTEAPNGEWNDALIRPYVDHAAACFGWERLMFGSDWPLCDLAGGYRRWLDFAVDACAGDAGAEQAFFSGTAERIYRLT